MLTYMLSAQDTTPLYQQLYRAIRQDIITGVLPSGERLPSKRTLAAHLKISTVTVEAAYGQLAAEGYIDSAPRRGYFVQDFALADAPLPHKDKPSPAISESIPQKTYPCDLRTNNMDTDCFPFSVWAKLARQTLTERSSALLEATLPQGALTLRAEIQRYLYHFRGLTVQPQQIIVGAGSEYLLGLMVQLLGRDKTYALEDPSYPKVYQTLRASGAQVLPMPLDEEGLREDILRRENPDVVYLTPSHHFPTGVVMPAARRLALLQWAQQAPNRYIIEDDYDSELRYRLRPIPALKAMDEFDHVIYLNTFAQSLAPSLRIGYLVLPQSLAERFSQQLGFYSSTVPSFEQDTLARFMASGAFERHLSRKRNLYKARREALLHALQNSALAPILHISGGAAGMHITVQIQNGMTEQQLIASAQAQGIALYGLSQYYHKAEPPESTVLLGYGGLAPQRIADAVERLCAAWVI